MSVTVYSKDIGEVRDRKGYGDYVRTLEDYNEDYIKMELRL